LRRILLIVCVFLSVVLFVNGLSVLSDNQNNKKIKYYNGEDYSEKYKQETTKLNQNNIKAGKGSVNIVVIGLDDEEARSDVIMLINYSPALGQVNILSIARDTRVRVKGKIEKINALYAMGGETLISKAVQQITGLPVKYYITLNFKGFRNIIDTLDGVQVDVPVDMVYNDPTQNLLINLKKGKQLLNGEKAEQFVRYRKGNKPGEGYIDGDIGRNRAQQQLVRELISQKVNLRYISKVDDIYNLLKRYMKTNIEIGDITYYAKDLIKLNYNSVRTFTMPGDSRHMNGIWYFICDQKGTKKLIEEHFY